MFAEKIWQVREGGHLSKGRASASLQDDASKAFESVRCPVFVHICRLTQRSSWAETACRMQSGYVEEVEGACVHPATVVATRPSTLLIIAGTDLARFGSQLKEEFQALAWQTREATEQQVSRVRNTQRGFDKLSEARSDGKLPPGRSAFLCRVFSLDHCQPPTLTHDWLPAGRSWQQPFSSSLSESRRVLNIPVGERRRLPVAEDSSSGAYRSPRPSARLVGEYGAAAVDCQMLAQTRPT